MIVMFDTDYDGWCVYNIALTKIKIIECVLKQEWNNSYGDPDNPIGFEKIAGATFIASGECSNNEKKFWLSKTDLFIDMMKVMDICNDVFELLDNIDITHK